MNNDPGVSEDPWASPENKDRNGPIWVDEDCRVARTFHNPPGHPDGVLFLEAWR